MTGRDDNDKAPFDDGDDWIDRDDDDARGPLIDRDDDEVFGAPPPSRDPGFPEERDYPAVPDWDDDNDYPEVGADWDPPSADNDDLNRLAERELGALDDDPYPPDADDPVPPMSPGAGAIPPAQSAAAARFADTDASDSFDNSGDDSWSDDSEASADAYGTGGGGYADRGAAQKAPAAGHPSPAAGLRRWPIAMLAVAAVAVVLLAVGGYGVISERSALEAEIRQLQAQLATAVSPEEARASRNAQQAMEQKNTALEAQLVALRAENSELRQTVSAMEAELEEQAAEAEKAVAAAQKAAEAAERRSATRSVTEATGAWFVNFGSYAQAGVARRWAGRLEVDTGRVVVQDARSGGDIIHRVRVVGLPDKSTADRVARQLEAKYELPKLWVGNN